MSAAVAAVALIAYLSVWGHRYGMDLEVYRYAANSWESGQNPYLLTFTGSGLSFTYPPFALIALWPLAWTPFPVTRRLLCQAFTWACVSCIALEPVRSATDYGQIELVLMGIVTADLLTPSRYRGIGTGLAAAVKLTPLAFVIVLAVSRDTKPVIRATATFLVCTGLPWLLWPRRGFGRRAVASQAAWLYGE